MKILLIVGGTNSPSNSQTLAEAFVEGMRQQSHIEVDTVRLRETPLEHFHIGFYDPSADEGKELNAIAEQIRIVDGVIIATPVWNFSIPAHLKNLIDRMGAFALDAETRTKGLLNHKPFFFLFSGGAPVPAWKGLMRFTTGHLPEAIRYFGGTVVGKHFEGKCTLGRGKFGLVINMRKD